MNKIVLISILLTGQTGLQGMHSTTLPQDTVLLVVGQEKTSVEISRNYALLSRTIRNSLEDARSSQSAEERITCPLQELSQEMLQVIIGHLGRVLEYRHTKNTDLLKASKYDLGKLSPVKLCEVARAIEYLDIPLLGVCCAEVVHEKLKPGVVDWNSIVSLPVSLLSPLLKQEVAALAGITYEDQVGYQASEDEDIDDVDPANTLARRSQVPVLSAEAVLRGHEQEVYSMCVTPDNKIVSRSFDNTVRVWDMHGTQRAVCRGLGDSGDLQDSGQDYLVCVTSDNKIVSGYDDDTIRIWDMRGTQLAVCEGHEEGITSLCVTSDNKIVSGSYDRTVRVWDMRGTQLAVCRGHGDDINSVCVTSDNKIVSGSRDYTARVWDMRGTQLAVLRGHDYIVRSVCVTSDNKIVSCGDWEVGVWDMQGTLLAAICGGSHQTKDRILFEGSQLAAVCSRLHEEGDLILCASVTQDNKIVLGSRDFTVRVWDMRGTQLAVCEGHEEGITSLCVTSDNKIVSGSYDRTVRVWDMEGTQLAVCKGHEGAVNAVCVTSDNKIVSAGSDDCTVRVWNLDLPLLMLVQRAPFIHSLDHAQALWTLLGRYHKETLSKEECLQEIKSLMSQVKS